MAGSKPGERRGGRQKNTPNKATTELKARLAELGVDYIQYLGITVNNAVPCVQCHGAGKTKFQPGAKGKIVECGRCFGSGKETIPPEKSAWAAAELMSYCEAKRKAVEHRGDEDGPPIGIRVEFV